MWNYNNFYLYFVVCTVGSLAQIGGLSEAWSSPTLPKLAINDHGYYDQSCTQTEKSLVVSLLYLGGAFGCITSLYVHPSIGKKKTIILFGSLMVSSYLLISFGRNVYYLYIARFLLGLGSSFCTTVLPRYLSELLRPKDQNILYRILNSFSSLGVMVSYTVGSFADTREFSFTCCLIIAFLLVFFNIVVPETPKYLASLGEDEEAEEIIRKLRAMENEEQISQELKDIVKPKKKESDLPENFDSNIPVKIFLVSLGLISLQQLCGMSVIISYMKEIFLKTDDQFLSSYSSMIVGWSKFISSLILFVPLQKLSKRNMLIISSAGCCITLSALGGYFYVKNNYPDIMNQFSWILVMSLTLYVVSLNIGLECASWFVTVTVLNEDNLVFRSSIIHTVGKFVAFSLTLCFPKTSETIGIDSCFWMFSVFCFLSMVFVFIFIPKSGLIIETKECSDGDNNDNNFGNQQIENPS